MKRTLALLLSLLLLFGIAQADTTGSDLPEDSSSASPTDIVTDPEDGDPYYIGAQEMFRQLELRTYSPGFSISGRDSTGCLDLFGYSVPASFEGYPNGIIVDEDWHCVLIAADSCVLTLYCSDEDQALEVTAGSVLLTALYCDGSLPMPDLWVHKDGTFSQQELRGAGLDWARAYARLVQPVKSLVWSSLVHLEDPILEVMGRVLACRNAASGITGWEVMDELLYPDAPDCIIIFDQLHMIVIQSQAHTWFFEYNEDCRDTSFSWTLFHVLMGGVELWDMQVAEVDEDGAVWWYPWDLLQEELDSFYDVWVTWPAIYTLE